MVNPDNPESGPWIKLMSITTYILQFPWLTNCWPFARTLYNFNDLYSDEKPASFLTRSFYSIHINRWLEYFNEEQIYLTTSQSILTNTSQVLSDIEDFLGVESYDLSLHRSQLKANEVTYKLCYNLLNKVFNENTR